jgi:hypothetical protein
MPVPDQGATDNGSAIAWDETHAEQQDTSSTVYLRYNELS